MEKAPIILAVDDDTNHLAILEFSLMKHLPQVRIVRASTAIECLNFVKAYKPDLVLLDYSLPDKNGLEILQSIQEIDAELPVIMVTGHGNEKIAVEAMKKGARDYILKSDGYLEKLPILIPRILQQRNDQQKQKTTELYYRDLVENSIDGVYLLDERGNIQLVNNVCTKLSGYKKRELVDQHFSFLFEENEYKQLIHKVRKDRRLKRLVQYQTYIKDKDNNYIPIELSVIPIKKGKKLIGYHGIVRDITERVKSEKEKLKRSIEIQKINEELLVKNRKLQELHTLKSQFVSNVGHELRTPLNGVLGYAELLNEGIYGELNDEQKRALKQIIHSGNHLLNLINELLDFAKIQSGKFKIYKDYCSVIDIVDAAVSTVRPSVEQKNIELICSIQPDLPHIFADSQKIYQVLLNILSNAMKFTSQGEIDVNVCEHEKSIQFSVRDTGIGIARTELENIFTDFHQVDGSFTRNYGGTGLGLSLAKFLVEAHHGKIWVESAPGSGSTFSFEIPIEFRDETEEPDSSAAEKLSVH